MLRRIYDVAARVPPLARLRQDRDRLSHEVLDLRAQLAATEADARRGGGREAELERVQAELRHARDELDDLRPEEPAYRLFPPGHFYSPIPDLPDVRRRADSLFDRSGPVLGVDVREEEQLALLDELGPALARWPYGGDRGNPGDPGDQPPDLPKARRFDPDNDFFGWTDSQLWYALLTTRRPHRIVEIGSGWSTALVLDACEAEGLDVRITAVEPYPERLWSLLRPGDDGRLTLRQSRAQDLSAEDVADVQPGDVLFVDSTHVAKVGSDVNHIVFEIFPRLPPGVLVHVHDIAYPFEYPREWVEEGRAWNEAYLLRAFLTDNPRWRVLLWPSWLWLRHPERMRAALHPGSRIDGGSLWLETV